MSLSNTTRVISTSPVLGLGGHHHHHHHTHDMGHHHGHTHGHGVHVADADLAEANKRHYDATAEDYDNKPGHKRRAERVGFAMREAVSLSKESSSALEFACGTGLVARQMHPFVKEMVGIDISPGAVERFNAHFKDMGADEGSYAVDANIATDKDILGGKKFDLVYCASAYHHFESPNEITKLLAGFLKPGGSLVVVDNIQESGENETVGEEHKAYVTRYGFVEDDLKGFFLEAGLEFESWSVIKRDSDDSDNDIFLAKAVLKVDV